MRAPLLFESLLHARDAGAWRRAPAVLAAVLGTLPAACEPGRAALPELGPGWTRIEPGGETVCARGTPYSFWARAGRADKLVIVFQGGGGCWDAETCRPGSDWFDDAVDESDDPGGQGGILDLDDPANPFRDHSIVYVPYCTGDVHWGDNVATYRDSAGGEVVIHHQGFVNASQVMEWVYERFDSPESILVTGCSAGSIASILFAPYVMEHYEGVPVRQLGDSEAFVFDRPVDLDADWRAHGNFPAWIPALVEMAPADFTMARFYAAVANHYPEHVFAQVNTAHDAVQIEYFLAATDSGGMSSGGSGRGSSRGPGGCGDGSWEDELQASLAEIQAWAPNFRSYLAGGDGHCILPLPEFYSLRVEGVRFRDWMDDLAGGREVEDVRCARCDGLE